MWIGEFFRGSLTVHANSIGSKLLNILTFGLLGPTQNTNSCDTLIQSLGAFRNSATGSVLSVNDPNLQAFAQELASICSTNAGCGGWSASDFLGGSVAAAYWAQEYVTTGKPLPTTIDGCGGGVTQSLANVALKTEVGQFTDLSGEGLASITGGGEITQQLVGQTSDTLVGWGENNSGNVTVVIGQAGANETFGAPAETYNLAASFGGDTANGTISNTPVYKNSTTNISPSAGTNATVTPPDVTGLSPSSGSPGTTIMITGSGFGATASGDQVGFNGTSAQVTNATTTSIEATVPDGATSGPVTVVDPSGSTVSSATFTVTGGTAVSVTVSPTTASVAVNGTQQFAVTVTGGTSGAVTWSVNGISGGNSTVGTISSSGLYTAPASIPSSGAVTVTATSQDSSSASASANVTIQAQGQVTLSPMSVTVPQGAEQIFQASVAGSSNGVTWSIEEGSAGGTIINSSTTTAVYVPPSATGTFHVVATSVDNPSESATATVTVGAPIEYSVLHSFGSGPDGSSPEAGLIQASDGNLYGTTYYGGTGGGTYGYGTVFKMNSSGQITILHSFNQSDGSAPGAALIQASDGNFYGTTSSGGNYCCNGTTFKMDASGNVATLHSFGSSSNDGSEPSAGLIQATDGNFYGTTGSGGAYHAGTIFKMDASGNVTIVHSFGSGSDGIRPEAGLIQASDGDLYGATSGGGAYGWGTIFKMDAAGNVTVLHSFGSGSDGSMPLAGLIQASDGDFYGTTYQGGKYGYGTVFKMDLSGKVTILYSFHSGMDGSEPWGDLIQASDGNFYGTTAVGGTYGYGTVFKMDAAGNVTILHSFDNSDGDAPLAGLIQASDGSLYGTTSAGGGSGDGTVFKITNP